MVTTEVVTGKVVQVSGPAVDCEFPEGQIPLVHTAIRITSEGFETLQPIDIICEVQQHIGEGRVRTIALQPTEGLVRACRPSAWDIRWKCRWVRNAGPRAQRDRPAGGRGAGQRQKHYPIHRPAPSFEDQSAWRCSRPASRSST
jgi:F-type H+-transporting ATPase subunit beta